MDGGLLNTPSPTFRRQKGQMCMFDDVSGEHLARSIGSYLLAHSSYPNLVKDRTAPASADADPDARELHAVRQPIQAIQLRLNRLTDDAIIQGHQEKTVRLSLEWNEYLKYVSTKRCNKNYSTRIE